MRGLNEALDALLYDRAARQAFLAGEASHLDVSEEDAEALRAIDPRELASAAELARTHVFSRSHRGVGRLVDAFRETIAAWHARHPGRTQDDLASDFVASAHFRAHRTVPFAGEGTSLEEAFYRFAEEADIGTPEVRLRECAVAILATLATVASPSFRLPPFVRRTPGGFFVIVDPGPSLFALAGGRFVSGPITPYLASVLDPDRPITGPLPAAAERASIDEELLRLGLRGPA